MRRAAISGAILKKFVGITQRVFTNPETKEVRDGLARDWSRLSYSIGINLLPIPNSLPTLENLLDTVDFSGFILSGGDDFGDFPERDRVETKVLKHSAQTDKPVIGVCRGMQIMHLFENHPLCKISGHVNTNHPISTNRDVNSYHNFGFYKTSEKFQILATSDDGVIESFRHKKYNWHGMMWHPERFEDFNEEDLELFERSFSH